MNAPADVTRRTPIAALPEWLFVAEVADLLGISTDLVYRLVASRELPARRWGRLIRIPREALR
jgi:excisionase family DNA binding protein